MSILGLTVYSFVIGHSSLTTSYFLTVWIQELETDRTPALTRCVLALNLAHQVEAMWG